MKLLKKCHCWMMCKMCAILTVICCNCLLNAQGKFTSNPKRTVKSNFQATSFHSKTKDEPILLPCSHLRMHEMEGNKTRQQTICLNYTRATGGIEGYYKRKKKITNPRLGGLLIKKQDWNDYTTRKFLFKPKLSNLLLSVTVRKTVQMNLEGKRMLRRERSIGSFGSSSSLQQNSSRSIRFDKKFNSSWNLLSILQQNNIWMFNEREGIATYEKIPPKYPIADVNKNRRSKHNNLNKYESRGKRSKEGMKRETLLEKSFDIGETDSQTSTLGLNNEPNVLGYKPRDLPTNGVSIMPSDISAIDPSDRFHHNRPSEMNIFSIKTKKVTSGNDSIFPEVGVILPSYMFSLKPNDHSVATSVLVTKRQVLNIQTSTPTLFTQTFPLQKNVETGRMQEKTKESEGELEKFPVVKDMLTDGEKCNNETETDIDKQETPTQKAGNATDFRNTVEGLDLNSMNCQAQVPPTEATDEKVIYFKHKYPVKLWTTLGLYDDTYLDVINSHWLSFEPPKPIIHKVFATIYGIFMVVGCGGNLLVIFMFVRCRSLRTPPNYLIANLAISDFLMMAKTPIYILNSLYQGPVMGAIGCKIYGFLGGLTGTASIMTLAAIALDRYYVIVYPLNPFKRTTVTRAILMISGVWLYAGTFSSIPLFGINRYTSEGYLTSCSIDYLNDEFGSRVFVLIFFLAAWLMPLTVISFSYINIFRMVRAAEKLDIFSNGGARSSGESFKYRQDPNKQKSEVKIAVLGCSIVTLWLLAWTPYALVALFGISGWKQNLTPLVSAVPALFCKTASCINPFVYAINHPRFQRELRSNFKMCFRYHPKRKSSHETSFYSAVTCREAEVSADDNKRQSRNKISTFRKKKVVIPSSAGVSTVSTTFQVTSIPVNSLKKPSFGGTGYKTESMNLKLTDFNQQRVDVESNPSLSGVGNTSLNSIENGHIKPRKYSRCQSVGNMNSNNFSTRLARIRRSNEERICHKLTRESRNDKSNEEADSVFHRATSLPAIIDLSSISSKNTNAGL